MADLVARGARARGAAMIVLDVVLGLLVALGVVIALVLLVPLSARVEGAIGDDVVDWSARVAWGLVLVVWRADGEGMVLRVLGVPLVRRRWGEARPERPRRRRRTEAAREPRRRRGVRWLLRRRRLLAALVRRYVRTLHPRGRVAGVIGLSEPEQTATLQLVLRALEERLPAGAIEVEVDWVDEVVDVHGRLGGWVWPLEVAALTTWLLVIDRRTWRALRAD